MAAQWLAPGTGLVDRIREAMASRGAHAARTVVLVPYAQLMAQGKAMWAQHQRDHGIAAGFMPRFQTTMNWASALEGAEPAAEDLTGSRARDLLVAQGLLESVGMGGKRELLAGRVVDAARQLAPLAAAVLPGARAAWAARLAPAVAAGAPGDAASLEALVARLALQWAAASAYPTDALLDDALLDGVECLVLLQGHRRDPLWEALQQRMGARAVAIAMAGRGTPPASAIALHEARDGEDEAQRAAACVLCHVEQGRTPVALVDTDRLSTRRIHATLEARGLVLRDETGWKLSTTRAGAAVMGALRACAWNASSDGVLDWIKNAPAFDTAVASALEQELRTAAQRDWTGFRAIEKRADAAVWQLAERAEAMRQTMREARALPQWLDALAELLKSGGQWDALAADPAGAQVLEALRLAPGAGTEWSAVLARSPVTGRVLRRRMRIGEFTAWVSDALEDASYRPAQPGDADVVVLPLPQLLGRPFAALVMPGCDELRLAAWPEPDGAWTAPQRAALGLPGRENMAAERASAWQAALDTPVCDLLWRRGDASGDTLLPSPLVQLLEFDGLARRADDPRPARDVEARPTQRPGPNAPALAVTRISASAYGDLRSCPYRFFALRQLRLLPADELDSEVDKRDFGVWLHATLQRFHEALAQRPVGNRQERLDLMRRAADAASLALGLQDGEFLPFAAAWPRVRDGYLDWLDGHERAGATFEAGERWIEQPLGDLTLVGPIDRIDRLPDGLALVIDYKTESHDKTKARLKRPEEDTQLAFYAALLADDTVAAAYLNVGEKEGTRRVDHDAVVRHRDALVEALLHDMRRVAAGAAMPALGAGMACEYCHARGICRRDFWAEDGAPP